MNLEKYYKVSFKTYQNERLNKVNFHGKEIYPLYIQVGYDRKTIYFKSYFFDLLSKPQYVMRHYIGNRPPGINEVIAKEEKLISYIVKKHNDNFSLDLFKAEYAWYSRDLINLLGNGFIDYLSVFFNDEGFNSLATMITLGGQYMQAISVWEGIQSALKPALAQKVLTSAVYYAPPYLPVLMAANSKGERNITTLSVFEWESEAFQKLLDVLLKKKFEFYDLKNVKKSVEALINTND
jgi:hypothetical protein